VDGQEVWFDLLCQVFLFLPHPLYHLYPGLKLLGGMTDDFFNLVLVLEQYLHKVKGYYGLY
jgi:hypothetical protein